MDFAALPPEVNSGRMYTGAGVGSWLTAAAAWDKVAEGLYAAASSYDSEITGLTFGWLGPSSLLMAAAAAPYLAWITATASLAEFVATKAKLVAAAFEMAFAKTVPPPLIVANRALLLALIATNFFGQNTPAIAITEAHYTEMWVQDAEAMYEYAATASAASQLTPFAPPAPTTNPSGRAGQLAAVAQAVGKATVTHAAARPLTSLHELIGSVSETLRLVASPTTGNLPARLQALLSALQKASYPMMAIRIATVPVEYALAMMEGSNMGQMMQRFALSKLPALLRLGALRAPLEALHNAVSPVSAAIGRAGSIGGLSVPPSWVADKAITPLAKTLPVSAAGGPSGTSWSQLTMAGLAGGAVGALASRTRSSVVPRSPAAG
ncbi:PPE family protein [Mycobacterium decipiens]|uniref:PPE family protein n=1 Tax=Mycobacterium decipiens TaxID=1430326 RepID=A0A1X2LTD6_9MYCO|nr:PPE family protein [Mycobacterium decipiens]OSC40067.1 hypothetical protein B8W66_14565 [Mycobacterium decipiens]